MDGPLGERVARLEALLCEVRDDVRAILKRLEQYDQRLSTLEQWRYWLAGVAAAVGVVVGAVWDWIKGGGR